MTTSRRIARFSARLLCLCLPALLALSAGGCKKPPKGDEPAAQQAREEKSAMKMRALLIPSPGADAVDVRIFFAAGSVDDPKGKEGLTNLTARMVAEGATKKHTYAELIQLLYPMAASIDVSVEKQATVFVGRVHKAHTQKYFPLLFEVLLEPKFAEEDFKRIKDETLNYLRKTLRQADDELLSKEALDTWLYEGQPYGHVVEGTVKGLESITLEDVRKHCARVLSQDRLVIGLAGAADEGMQKMFEEKLAQLPEAGAKAASIPDPKMPEGLEVRIVEKTTDSTAVTLGVPVKVKRGSPDFYPLMLAFSCLGEHRQSMGRLFRTIREARGFNYGDYAYIEHFIQEGDSVKPMVNVPRARQEMSVWIRPVQDKHAVFALRLALFELKKFIDKGLTQEELDRTRGFLLGYTRVLEEQLTRRLGYALDDLFYRTPPFLRTARETLEKTTLEEVNAAIKRNISADNLKIIIVTSKAQEIKTHLLGGTVPPVEYDAPKPPEVLEQDKVILQAAPVFKPEKLNVIPVDSLFE